MRSSRTAIDYFGRRNRSFSVNGLLLNASWLWDFGDFSISREDQVVLSPKKRKFLLEGIDFKIDDTCLKARLNDGQGSAGSVLSVRHCDYDGESVETVDYQTRIAKLALLMGFLGLVYT